MNELCLECTRLQQEYTDAIKFEVGMLTAGASQNGDTMLLAKVELVVREAARRRVMADQELNRHKGTHHATGNRIMRAHGASS